MRIGLITPGFSASEKDWCIPAVLDLVRELAADDDVTVLSLRYPHTRERYEVYGARVVPFGGAQRRGLARLPLLLKALIGLVDECHKRRFDVLHALWAHEPGFLAVLAGRLTGTPVVVSLFGGELVDLPDIDYGGQRSSVNRWLIRRALDGADRVTVGSQYLHEIAASHVESGKLVRWSLGVDRSRFSPVEDPLSPVPSPTHASHPPRRGAPPRVPLETTGKNFPPLPGGSDAWVGEGWQGGEGPVGMRILHVASLSPVKDQATLLRAFAIVAGQLPTVRLHVLGDGDQREVLERLAGELGIAERVEWHGAVPHDALPDHYRQADLFVLSSRFESQGMVVLEAAACGCPVTGTAVGVLPELTDKVVPPGDVEGLADVMLASLEEHASTPQSQVDALDLGRSVENLRRLYRSLISSH